MRYNQYIVKGVINMWDDIIKGLTAVTLLATAILNFLTASKQTKNKKKRKK